MSNRTDVPSAPPSTPMTKQAANTDRFDGATSSEQATAVAMQDTLLTPRFYTTNFDELDRIDVTPVRKDWDELIARMKSDPNRHHFKKGDDWDPIDWDNMEPELKKEFIDFLISSCSG